MTTKPSPATHSTHARLLQLRDLPIARRQVHHAARAECRDRAAYRDLHAFHQLALSVHDVIHRAAGDCLRRNRADPDVALGVRANEAGQEHRLVVRQLARVHEFHLRWRHWHSARTTLTRSAAAATRAVAAWPAAAEDHDALLAATAARRTTRHDLLATARRHRHRRVRAHPFARGLHRVDERDLVLIAQPLPLERDLRGRHTRTVRPHPVDVVVAAADERDR